MLFLAILLLIFNLYFTLSKNTIMHKIAKSLLKKLPKDKTIREGLNDISEDKEYNNLFIKLGLFGIVFLIVTIIEFIFIVLTLKHNPLILIYLIYSIIRIINKNPQTNIINDKLVRDIKIEYNPINLSALLHCLIHITYYVYIITILI